MLNYITNQKLRYITIGLLAFLVIQMLIFGIWFSKQPSQKNQILNIVDEYKHVNGAYKEEKRDNDPSIDATYAASSILSLLASINKVNVDDVTSFILSKYDTPNTIFLRDGEPSLEETYSAIGALSVLNQEDLINASQVITSISVLATNDSLYRDFNEDDPLHRNLGELDHLFQAVSIFDKLYTNKTEFYLQINRTNIAIALSNLQNSDGGINEATVHPISNMRNAYHLVSIITKLNSSVEFIESHGFSSLDLISWIERQYTDDGFRFQFGSVPTSEATAYALIALSRLGWSSSEIKSKFHEGIEEMTEHLSFSLDDEEVFKLDTIHDVILSLSKIDHLSVLDNKFVTESFETVAGWVFGITILLFIIVAITKIYFVLVEDESDYFEIALSKVVELIHKDRDTGIRELSKLLQLKIEDTVMIPHKNERYGTIRAISKSFEFLVSYEFDIWEPKELLILKRGSSEDLLNITFHESQKIIDVQLKINEAINSS